MAKGRRLLTNVPILSRRSWEDVAPELERFLKRLWESEGDGIPAGFGANTTPVAVTPGATGTPGTGNTSGWAAADHQHPVVTGVPSGLDNANAVGVSAGIPRLDHKHKRDVRIREDGGDKGTRNALDFGNNKEIEWDITDDPGGDLVHVEGSLGPAVTIQNGFEDTGGYNDTSMSFVDLTRTFSIQPTGASYEFWSGGNHFVKVGTDSIVISDVEGLHNIYFDSTGTLQELTGNFDPVILIENNAFVACVYWNATANQHESFLNERHGREMDAVTHAYLHRTFGTRFDQGLGLSLGAPSDSSGASDTHAQFGVVDGIIWDEDIRIEIESGFPQTLSPSPGQFPIYYLEGASAAWRRIAATNFPVHPFGTGRPAWNNVDAGGVGIWGLTEITNNDFVLAHVFATDDIENPVIVIMGQGRYTTLADARTGADTEIQSITTGQIQGAFNEFVALATVIFECRDAYANAVNARIRTTTTGDDYVDWRFAKAGASGGISVSSHNNLAGLQGGSLTERYHLTAAEQAVAILDPTFARGGVLVQDAGITVGGRNVIVWRAPFNCDVVAVKGYRVGGTGATINARINGASTHLASDLSLTSADTWLDGGAVQNVAYTVGDRMEIQIVTVAGSPTQVAVQVDLRRT